jgi:hypothetical protein
MRKVSPTLLIGIGWFAVVLLLKGRELVQPPVWDSAMGIFPAAIFLSENGFDVFELLQQKNWWQGGPNVHALSLMTWFVALILKITGDAQSTFVLLHIATFAGTAMALSCFFRLMQFYGFNTSVSFLATTAVLLFPVLLVQVGYIYTEIPVMVCSLYSVYFLSRGRIYGAVTLAIIALFIKLTAVALVFSLGLVLAVNIFQKPYKTLACCGVLGLSALVAWRLPELMGQPELMRGGWGSPELLFHQLSLRMEAVPDLAGLMILALIAVPVLLILRLTRQAYCYTPVTEEITLSAYVCLLVPIAFSVAVIVGSFNQTLLIPRYLVPVIPFAMMSILLLLRETIHQRLIAILLVLCSLYLLLNYSGRFYPTNTDSFSVVERSHAYKDYNATKSSALAALKKQSNGIPAYVTREIHYMNSHAMIGYVDPVIANVYPIFAEPYSMRGLGDYPEHFFMLKASTIHGGKQIDRILKQAQSTGSYHIKEQLFENSGFKAWLYEVRKKNK